MEAWERWQEAERRRRVMAERLFLALANRRPGNRYQEFTDYVMATAVDVRLRSSFEAQEALRWAPSFIAWERPLGPGEEEGIGFRSMTGSGGLIFLVHMDNSSAVFQYMPWKGLVLICEDDMPDHCQRLYLGDPGTPEALSEFYDAVARALAQSAAMSQESLRRDETA